MRPHPLHLLVIALAAVAACGKKETPKHTAAASAPPAPPRTAGPAEYTVIVKSLWTKRNFPLEYPNDARFSGLIGASHNETYGAAALPTNTWAHLAATYDGAALRLYVNGTQVSSQPASGNIVTSANPLQIGGDSLYGQFFTGTIDEVRVYSVALSPSQIQADMVTALGDTVPVVSLSASSVAFGNQTVGTTSTPRPVTLTNAGSIDLSCPIAASVLRQISSASCSTQPGWG